MSCNDLIRDVPEEFGLLAHEVVCFDGEGAAVLSSRRSYPSAPLECVVRDRGIRRAARNRRRKAHENEQPKIVGVRGRDQTILCLYEYAARGWRQAAAAGPGGSPTPARTGGGVPLTAKSPTMRVW